MDERAYFERIRFDGPVEVTIDTLRALHRAHCLSVPFENLDIHLGRRILLDAHAAYDKIIKHRRGGFCYELNLLFFELLRKLGFEASILEGRVIRNGANGLSHGHLMLLVELDEPWLVDVGFGDGSLTPLALGDRSVQSHPEGRFQIAQEGDTYTMWCQTLTEGLEPQYQFDLRPRALEAFAERCLWTQTSKESGFVQRLICSLPTKEGRQGILGSDLVTFRNGQKTSRELSPDERDRLLIEFFGIDLEGVRLP